MSTLTIYFDGETTTMSNLGKKRYAAWRKYGKQRVKGKLEYIYKFDERVYKLGLNELSAKHCDEWLDPEKERPKAGSEIIFIDAVGMYRGVYHVTRSGVVHVHGNKSDCIEWENIYQWIPYPKEK